MRARRMTWPATMVVFAVLTLPGLTTAKEGHNKLRRYTVQDLGTLGGTFSLAGGINSRGRCGGLLDFARGRVLSCVFLA